MPLVYSDCLPFTQIPHTSRLFADFLYHYDHVAEFYSRPPLTTAWLHEENSRLKYDGTQRERIASLLERQNKSWGASPETHANIQRLRAGAASVVTGQQVGLFGGPAFSLYKALTAIKVAAEFTKAGVDSVPVFWLATEDHDFAEVSYANLPAADGSLQRLDIPSNSPAEAPVGQIVLGDQIISRLHAARALLGGSAVLQVLQNCYTPADTMGSAFAKIFAHLFAPFGLIVLDPSDREAHEIARPILEGAVTRAVELNRALQSRGQALESAGYHQQVKVTNSSTLLFHIDAHARTPVHLTGERFTIGRETFSTEDMERRVREAPHEFSAAALLRPVIQDYLLPTIANVAGPSEIAYFAQSNAVYESLLGRIPPVLPRFSATLVEPRAARLLDRYKVGLPDLFHGVDATRELLAARTLPAELDAKFTAAFAACDASLPAVTSALDQLDHTLLDAANRAASKMRYQLHRLHRRAARAHLRRTQEIAAHADQLTAMLYPDKTLQERSISGVAFLARHGTELLHQLYAAVELTCPDHQVVRL
jgi:bacillithiol synthase